MAFLAQDDKQQQDPSQQAGQSTQPGQSSGGAFAGGGSTSTSPSGGQGQTGTGGSGGWTNIQDYLTANQNTTGSADALKSRVGSAFDKEQGNLDSQSGQAKQQGQSQVDNQVGTDQATKMINQASSQYGSYYGQPQYQYSSGQASIGDPNVTSGMQVQGSTAQPGQSASTDPSAYKGTVDYLHNQLTQGYAGPRSFQYQMGSDASTYGNELGDNTGFQGLMGGIYNRAAGGQMGSGAMSLQQQLDQQNPALNNTRSNLMNQWSGLNTNVKNTTDATNQALQGDQNQYGQNQQALSTALRGMATGDKGAIDTRAGKMNSDISNVIGQMNAEQQAKENQQMGGLLGSSTYGQSMGHDAYNYQGGNADDTNATGVDNQRTQYDTLQDIFGSPDQKINYSGPYQFGNIDDHYTQPNIPGAVVSTNHPIDQSAGSVLDQLKSRLSGQY